MRRRKKQKSFWKELFGFSRVFSWYPLAPEFGGGWCVRIKEAYWRPLFNWEFAYTRDEDRYIFKAVIDETGAILGVYGLKILALEHWTYFTVLGFTFWPKD